MTAARLAELLSPWLGAGPAYRAVAAGLRGLVLDGRLPLGARVPSERDLAAALAVSRTTISAAYDVLRTEGYLSSNHGGGSRVTLPHTAPTRPDADPADPCPDESVLDLTVAALPAPAQLVDAVDGAARAVRPLLAGHGLHPYGLPELRAGVAAHLTGRGLPTRADQILITSGALHGWDLLLRALTRPGDRVVVEQPSYPGVADAVRAHRLRPLPLPVSVDGWDAAPRPAALAHVTPDGHNPTGLVASTAQRRALLAAVRDSRVVADETFADLILDGAPTRPLASLDRRVITLGSMSKAFWAGLRVGWVRADPALLTRLAQLRAGQDLSSPVLDQLVAAHLLEHAAPILTHRRAQLRQSRDALVSALARHLPQWRHSVPRAGMVLWVELPAPGATRLAGHALDLGVRLTPGPRFTLHGTADRHLRLPFTLPAEQMESVARVLAEAASRVADGAAPAHQPGRWTA